MVVAEPAHGSPWPVAAAPGAKPAGAQRRARAAQTRRPGRPRRPGGRRGGQGRAGDAHRRRAGGGLAEVEPGRDAAARGQRPHRPPGLQPTASASGAASCWCSWTTRLQQAQLKQAEAQASIARTNLQRSRELLAQNFVSQSAVDQNAAGLQVAEAQVALAQAQLARMRVLAPFDGTAGLQAGRRRRLRQGRRRHRQYRRPDGADGAVRAARALHRPPARRPDRSTWRSTRLPGRSFKGRVQAVDSQVDANGRALQVLAQVDNPGALLKPGMFARPRVVFSVREGAVVVPEEALVPLGAKQFVFKVVDGADGQKVSQRLEARIGLRLPGKVEIARGPEGRRRRGHRRPDAAAARRQPAGARDRHLQAGRRWQRRRAQRAAPSRAPAPARPRARGRPSLERATCSPRKGRP